MKTYITTTISPMMLMPKTDEHTIGITIKELNAEEMAKYIKKLKPMPAVGHAKTAEIIEKLFGLAGLFARTSITLDIDDIVLAVIPQFRADESREYTKEELDRCKFRFFHGSCYGVCHGLPEF